MKNALIIGGTSGLGLELGEMLKKDFAVVATGRRIPEKSGINFVKLNLSNSNEEDLDKFVNTLPQIDFLCIAAGFFQEGTITEISDREISEMIEIGLRVPAILIKKILNKQGEISTFIPITSTSQWTPRLKEPIYTAIKGGFGMLANSLSLDKRIKKTLLVGPAGMKTRFWENTEMETDRFLEPKWVAEQILKELDGEYSYKFVKIMRDPARVEVAEIRE